MMKRSIALTVLIVGMLGNVTACGWFRSSHASQAQKHSQDRQTVRKQIEAVLTPDQAQQLQSQLQQGKKLRPAVSSLDLTADQKTKIQQIFQTARAQRLKSPQASSPESSP